MSSPFSKWILSNRLQNIWRTYAFNFLNDFGFQCDVTKHLTITRGPRPFCRPFTMSARIGLEFTVYQIGFGVSVTSNRIWKRYFQTIRNDKQANCEKPTFFYDLPVSLTRLSDWGYNSKTKMHFYFYLNNTKNRFFVVVVEILNTNIFIFIHIYMKFGSTNIFGDRMRCSMTIELFYKKSIESARFVLSLL